jgi:L-threonylcarbamoyladenylate synthase
MIRTRLIKLSPINPERSKIALAAKILRNGGLVAFPTETVYGVGSNALDPIAIKRIYSAKGRPADNPLIIHIAEIEDLKDISKAINRKILKLAEKFWPGPLTLVLPKSNLVPKIATGGMDTIAVRMPDHNIARSLIRLSGVPIAAPSANISGRPSPTRASHVIEDLWGKVDMIIDGGKTAIGLESTVLDMTSSVPVLLRPGGLPLEKLNKVIENICLHPCVENPNYMVKNFEKPNSPGMQYRHYSPKADLIVVEGPESKVTSKIKQISSRTMTIEGKKVCIVTRRRHHKFDADIVRFVGTDSKSFSKNLFDAFRHADRYDVDVIITEGIETFDLGLAIMNRLKKAANEVINTWEIEGKMEMNSRSSIEETK